MKVDLKNKTEIVPGANIITYPGRKMAMENKCVVLLFVLLIFVIR